MTSGIKLKEAFCKFVSSQESNDNYRYWNVFIYEIYSTFRDFELSVRKGDWKLFTNAVSRSLDIFFAAGKTNYSRYGSLFYEDIMDLQRKFPYIYRHFNAGGFVCNMTQRSASGIGFDQALEKCYNYTAKAIGGIIGITRQQESRTLWDLIKHEKEAYLSFLHTSVGCEANKFGELNSLHHEFNQRSAKCSNKRVSHLVEYLRSIKSTFSSSTGE